AGADERHDPRPIVPRGEPSHRGAAAGRRRPPYRRTRSGGATSNACLGDGEHRMTTFAAQATTLALPPPDPLKHVNYVLGMVLGVDDFTQEFTYLSARERWLARDAIGYGTLWGLGV